MSRLLTLACLAAAAIAMAGGQSTSGSLEPGALPDRWTGDTQPCDRTPAFHVHEYNPTVFIIRQSGCTNFEKPFLYMILGSREAMLVDTGATGWDPTSAVDEVLRRDADRRHGSPLPLVAVHSHGHGDHVAGDAALRKRRDTRVVDATPEAVARFFRVEHWPDDIGRYDLGDRAIDAVPIPGHERASIALYDARTGILLTGDTMYPGRLYVRDADAFRASVDRLVAFTAGREIAHVLGAHIENRRTPFLDYPEGTTFQPEEHALELGRAHLLELQDALQRMNGPIVRRSLRDFTIWPIQPK